MEKEFKDWYKKEQKRFAHGQLDEKQIAYLSWIEGKKQVLNIPVVRQSALKWWNACIFQEQLFYANENKKRGESLRHPDTLTGREIELIYNLVHSA